MLCVAFEVVPAELTMRPVRLAYLHSRVLGVASGVHVTLVNYTKNSFGLHFDTLHILGDDPFMQEAEAKSSPWEEDRFCIVMGLVASQMVTSWTFVGGQVGERSFTIARLGTLYYKVEMSELQQDAQEQCADV